MSRTVYKFVGFPSAIANVSADSKVVLFAEQHAGSGEPMLWVETDPGKPNIERVFRVHGTGHAIPDGERHVASCIAAGGALVWHLYEVEAKDG